MTLASALARYALGSAFLGAVLTPRPALAVASAELYRMDAQRYGRYEARIRYAAGDGVVSSFFLWKVGSETPGVYWNELDFEKLGADCHMQTNALYGNPLVSTEQLHTVPATMCDAYHDYRFEWTPTYLAWFIDGQEVRRDTGAVAAAFEQNAGAGMRIHFNVWPGNANFGGNFDPAILPVRQYISWVQYSSFANDAFTVQWREEFNGTSLPSGWATGNWGSPYNLPTHHRANVTFVNAIAVLSVTSDNGTGFTGTPPPYTGGAGNASGAAGGAAGSSGGAPPLGMGGTGAGATGGAAGAAGASGAATAGAGGMTTPGAGGAPMSGAGGAPTAGAGGAPMSGAGGAPMAGAGGATSGGSGMPAAAGLAGAATSMAGHAGGGATAMADPAPRDPTESAPDSACGCQVPGGRASALDAALCAFALAGLLRRRGRPADSRRSTSA
jgi:hypothetical protein